ncbi:hypothetical protein [Streptomyces sp. PR69]|uniref:hypothetical protein n=1 Tax=Streptomyces sp. PR69 TaxID=2984950 RepID=UPI00226443C1|nr:hypothetical protein [Streptomyces sp. PR69]
MKLFRRTTLVSIACAAAVAFSGVGTAHAAVETPATVAVSSEDVSQQQIDELAKYLEAIYEGELRTFNGEFNRNAAVANFGTEFADAVETEIKAQRATSSAAKGSPALMAAKSKDSYGKCLLKAVGLGGLGGASAAIMNKLSEKKWSDAARLITKEAVKRGIKIGVKGGVVGLAASLAASAVWCATPWA